MKKNRSVYNLASRLTSLAAMTLSIFVYSSTVNAASNSGISYHGRILKPDGTPLESASVQFKLQIRTGGAEACVMFEELQNLNMRNTGGVFSITINDGSGSRQDSSGYTIDQVFQNKGAFSFPTSTCQSGSTGTTTWTPNAADGRKIKVLFKDTAMSDWEPLPDQMINFVPMAIESKQVGGFTPQHLLRVDDAAAAANATPLTLSQLNELQALSTGSSANYLKQSTNGVVFPNRATDPAAAVAGQIWFDTATSQLKYNDGSTTKTLSSGGALPALTSGNIWVGNGSNAATSVPLSGDATLAAGGALTLKNTGTAGSYYKVTTDAQGRVASGVASLAETDLPTISTAGKVSGSAITSGTIAGSTAVNTSGNVTAGNLSTNNIYLNANGFQYRVAAPAALSANRDFVLPNTNGATGNVLSTDGAGNLSWAPAGAGSQWTTTGSDIYYNTGKVGIGTSAPTSNLSFSGDSPQKIGMERNTTVAGANYLTVVAGGAKAGTTDLGGGDLYLSSGISTGTGASGILFQTTMAGSTGTASNFPTTKMAISGAGNVGIGTTSPSYLLHVTDGTTNPTFQIGPTTGNDGNASIYFSGKLAGAASQAKIYADYASSLNYQPSSGGSHYFRDGAGNPVLQLMNGGNVGIGTTSPTVTLDMNGRKDAIRLPAGNDSTERPTTPTAGMIRYNTTANGLEFHNGSTWAPLATGGGSYLSTGGGTLGGALTVSAGGISNTGGLNNNSSGITNAGSIAGTTTLTGSATGLTVSAGGTNQALTLSSTGTGAVNVGTGSGTGLKVLDAGAATANYIAVKGAASGASPQIAAAGSDTDVALDLFSKGASNIRFNTGGGSQFRVVNVANTVNWVQAGGSSTGQAPGIGAGGSDSNIPITVSATGTGNVVFVTGAGTQMRVLDSGGTAVNHVTAKGATTGNAVALAAAGTDTDVSLSLAGKGSGSVIVPSGYFGIGTTAPSSQLQIATTGSTANFSQQTAVSGPITFSQSGQGTNEIIQSRAASGWTRVVDGTWLGSLRTAGFDGASNIDATIIRSEVDGVPNTNNMPGRLVFLTTPAGSATATEKMRITNAGNVGVGTTSPGATLDVTVASGIPSIQVKATANSMDATSRVIAKDSGGSPISMLNWVSASGVGVFGMETNHPLTIETNGTERIRVTAAGSVGIGTTSPTVTLDMNGRKDAVRLPAGNDSTERPGTPGAGMIRYNTTANGVEFHNGTSWQTLGISGAGITSLTAGAGLTGGTINTSGQTIAVDVGTTTGKIVQVGASDKLPAIDGSNLTNLNTSQFTAGTLPIARGGTNSATPLNSNRLMVSSGGAIVESAAMTDGQIVVGKNSSAPQLVAMSADAAISNTGAVTVQGLRGRSISATLPTTTGQVYRYDSGTSTWIAGYLGMADIRSTSVPGNSMFANASCTAGQALSWSSLADQFSCVSISITKSQVSDLGTIGTAASKDTGVAAGNIPVLDGSGKLAAGVLPTGAASQWTTATSDIYYNTGNVGIGTTSPDTPIDVVRSTASTAAGTDYGAKVRLNATNTSASSRTLNGLSARADSAGAGANAVSYLKGGDFWALHSGTGAVSNAFGTYNFARNNNTGSINMAAGAVNQAVNSNNGSITSGYGSYNVAQSAANGTNGELAGSYNNLVNSSTGTITNGYASKNQVETTTVGGSLTNGYGGYFDVVQTAGTITNAYGIYLGPVQGTNRWSIFASDAGAPSHFAGNVGIGTTTPSNKLNVAAGNAMSVRLDSQVTADNGMYLGAQFNNAIMSNAIDWDGSNYVTKGFDTSMIQLGSGKFQVFAQTALPGVNTLVERFTILPTGNVGIGTTAPSAKLDVNGAIITAAPSVTAGTTIDFGAGNLQYTSQSCGAIQLNNVKNGGTYTLAIQGTSNASPCSFAAYSGAGTGTVYTVKMPPDHMVPVSGKHTLYSFTVLGDFVYVSWVPGY